MLIDNLIIKETFPIQKVIRDIKFNLDGLNLIVDESNSNKGNGVGKTTFLRLIDICFGARDRKAIYTDPETSSINNKLKKYIEDSKVTIEMVCINSVSKKRISLVVELFQNGARYIDNQKYNYNDYVIELNKIVFENDDNIPTFRKIIGKYIRVNMNGDNNRFLYFNDHCTNDEYQNIYNHIFKFKNIEIENDILKLRESIKDLENQYKMVKQSLKYVDLNQIDAKISVLTAKIRELEALQQTYINNKIVLNEDKIMENRKQYSMLNRECEKLLFDIKILEENLEKEISNTEKIDMESLKEFYDDVKLNISNLNKKFEELVLFNSKLNKNQISTYRKLLEIKNQKLNDINKKKEEFYEQNKDYMFLIESGNLDDYLNLQDNLNNYQTRLGECYNARDIYFEYDTKLKAFRKNLERELEKNKNNNNVQENLKIFNSYFTEYSKKTAGAEYFLYYNDNGFPLSISNVDGSFSTGTRKTAIISFDLAYIKYSKTMNISCPKFVVHDVLESIYQNDFYQTIELIKQEKFQYIAAILNQSISMHDNIDEDKDIILRLSEQEKLFLI